VESPVPVPGAPPGQTPASRQGCGRAALIGCGVAGLLFLAVVVTLLLYARRNPAFLTDLMMRQIESHYGADVTEDEKKALRAAYRDFREAVAEKRVSQAAVKRLQVTLSAGRSGSFDGEQVRALTQAFRSAAGGTPEAPPVASPSAPAVTRIP
jgi:hypothetical protein